MNTNRHLSKKKKGKLEILGRKVLDASQSVYSPPICVVLCSFSYFYFYIEAMIPPTREWASENQRREDWHWTSQCGRNFWWGIYSLLLFHGTYFRKFISSAIIFADILHMEIILNEVTTICQMPVSGIMTIFNDYNVCTGCLMLSSVYRLKSWSQELSDKTMSPNYEMSESGF